MEKKTTKRKPAANKLGAPTGVEAARASLESAIQDSAKQEEKVPYLDTVALRLEQLQKGLMYSCILSGKKRVQYIGNKTIKWFSQPEDDFKTSEVSDYQLKPLEL